MEEDAQSPETTSQTGALKSLKREESPLPSSLSVSNNGSHSYNEAHDTSLLDSQTATAAATTATTATATTTTTNWNDNKEDKKNENHRKKFYSSSTLETMAGVVTKDDEEWWQQEHAFINLLMTQHSKA